MDSKEYNLDAIRRVAERLRTVGHDGFSENLAACLERELARRNAADSASGQQGQVEYHDVEDTP